MVRREVSRQSEVAVLFGWVSAVRVGVWFSQRGGCIDLGLEILSRENGRKRMRCADLIGHTFLSLSVSVTRTDVFFCFSFF